MMPFKSIALIPAAGMGRRMGASINKQYLQLGGMPIVARTVSVFEQSPLIDAIYLVIPAEEIPYCQEHVVEAYRFSKVVAIVPGGKERQHSVMNGLRGMKEHVSGNDIILIHDGVRPLITVEALRESIAAASSHDGGVMAVQAKDTIKSVKNGIVTSTLDRTTLWQAQTPQAFRFSVIFSAHQAAETDHYLGTDDASLVERIGGTVRIIQGDYHNIKITTPEDLILAEAFLSSTQKTRARHD
ncbi:MAG TPA: 2-C-methyl-D-erythritol 4-phosphate cytidylyltransferase [Desulfuromonadales bacterium]|nr:2-C-methyl-D-erythritol 4-phosphate cytidylyltransferase [Desulfuromonadales bacterium]